MHKQGEFPPLLTIHWAYEEHVAFVFSHVYTERAEREGGGRRERKKKTEREERKRKVCV